MLDLVYATSCSSRFVYGLQSIYQFTPLGDALESFPNILGLLTIIMVFLFSPLSFSSWHILPLVYRQLRFRNYHSNNQYPRINMCKNHSIIWQT